MLRKKLEVPRLVLQYRRARHALSPLLVPDLHTTASPIAKGLNAGLRTSVPLTKLRFKHVKLQSADRTQ